MILNKKIISLFTILNILFFTYNILNFNEIIKKKPLSYDEVNLKIATQSNLKDIWLGKESISFKEFLNIGIKKINKQSISETSIARENDNFYLRNHHGILNLILSKLFEKKNFNGINNQNYFILFISIIIFFLYFKKTIFFNHLINLIIFVISSTWFLHSFVSTTHHVILGISFVIISASILEYNTKKKNNYLFFLILAIAIAILTLETSILFIPIFLLFFFIRNYKDFNFKKIIKYFFLLLIIIFIIYPGFYYTLDYFKSSLILFYRIFFDNTLNTSETISLLDLALNNFIFLIFILISLIVLIFKSNKNKIYLSFLLVTGLLYIGIMIPNLFDKSYLFPGLIVITYASVYSLKDEINQNKFLTLILIPIFFLNQFNFFYLNKKYTKKPDMLFQELTGYEYSSEWFKDLNKISLYLKNKNNLENKNNIYSDYPRIFQLYQDELKLAIFEAYIENEDIIISKNYERKNFFNQKFNLKNINNILILQTRLLNSNIEQKLINLKFYKKNLKLYNFTIFENKN